MKHEEIKCSFCGKSQTQVSNIISGPGVFICNECIDLCQEIILNSNKNNMVDFKELDNMPKPKEILAFLNEYVVGQFLPKETLAVAVYNHYKKAYIKDPDVELDKSNIICIGPTGCGKTLMAETLARRLKVPFVIVDSKTFSETGYVGEDVTSILSKLIKNSDGDVELAERGIIYLDEIDKINKKSDMLSRDVSGEGVQQSFLKMLDGCDYDVPVNGAKIKINTKKMLFICGGAFDGLNNIIKNRLKQGSIGFSCSKPDADKANGIDIEENVQVGDLIAYGLVPEFVGRFPVITVYSELTEEMMMDILTKPKNAIIKQFQLLFKVDGAELEFSDEALREIAKEAIKRKTGARGLRSILETILLDLQFNIPGNKENPKIVIDKKYVISKMHKTKIIEKVTAAAI